jgi:hypothetical protein
MNKPLLAAGFAVKVLLGLLYGYIFLHYYNGDDTWKIFRASISETELLLNNPRIFFVNEFTPANALATGRNAFEIIAIYLNELQYVLLVKSMALMNLVTNGNYYINVVFFNGIVFFGHYWLYRMMSEVFPQKKKIYFVIIFFFLPAVFWLSGIRVDGMLFVFVSMLLRGFTQVKRKGIASRAMVVIGFFGVLVCRPQMALLVLMSGIGYYLHLRLGRPGMAYGAVYLLALLVFFLPITNFSGIIAEKQNEFSNLKGTKFRLDKLEGTPGSFIKVLPQAAGNTFVRPVPWEAKGFLQLMASAEVIVFWTIFITSVVYRHSFWKLRLFHPVVFMLLMLGVSTYIFIGYLVPFPGAIVRYKAIPELLILCGIVSLTRWGEHKNYNKLSY